MRGTRLFHVAIAGILALACERDRPPTAAPGEPLPGLTRAESASFRAGRAQFNRVFTPQDGLGPLFNENQCSACHTDPAPGGTGGTRVVKATRFVAPDSCDRLSASGGQNIRRQAIPAASALGISRESTPPEATAQGRFTPPPLFGLGLVELIPEETILARADPMDRDGDRISGRAGRTAQGTLGRFGRKAETATLMEFTDQALRFEMGLTTTLTPVESGFQGRAPPPGTDLVAEPEVDATVLTQLVQFVRYLAPPPPAEHGAAHRDSVAQGERVFQSLGCDACHVPSMRTGPSAIGALDRKTVLLYSDLLLHDMGPDLADVCGLGAAPSEIRTEPLMGLRYRDVFLHSGRTTDLTEAILLHRGEAQAARDAFAGVSMRSRLLLVAFLNSL